MKMVILQDGKRIVTDRLTVTEHGNPITKEYDLSKATNEEFVSLQQNPHNEQLIAEVTARRVR